MAVNTLWRGYSSTGRKIALRDINEILGNYALLYDFTLGIYAILEQIKSVNTLHQSPLFLLENKKWRFGLE